MYLWVSKFNYIFTTLWLSFSEPSVHDVFIKGRISAVKNHFLLPFFLKILYVTCNILEKMRKNCGHVRFSNNRWHYNRETFSFSLTNFYESFFCERLFVRNHVIKFIFIFVFCLPKMFAKLKFLTWRIDWFCNLSRFTTSETDSSKEL